MRRLAATWFPANQATGPRGVSGRDPEGGIRPSPCWFMVSIPVTSGRRAYSATRTASPDRAPTTRPTTTP